MDVYEASANMVAFSDFVVAAAKATYGGQIDARAEVAGFGRGSFITDIVFNVVGPAATIFSALHADSLAGVIKEAVSLWKHLKGQPPTHVTNGDKNQVVHVSNNNGEIIQVSTQTLNLVVFDDKAGEAVKRFVHDAVGRPGIDSVHIGDGKQELGAANQDEANFFVPVRPSETVTDTVFKQALIIEAPVFKDGLKWRFSDGQSSFFAEIRDKDFLARVDAGERFGKGDVLHAEVRFVQERSGMKLSGERYIEKVLDHSVAPEQARLI